ncbi:response regulator [uncultured Cellulomonas sp.]|uniref:response regulator n=1 Tax=uncultured Cellulomonas sp. TaxID=189682 RepID=UPI0028ECA372|nr:response regulator [uncultured Cellulomonas sp.]
MTPRVLVVDDEPDELALLARHLRRLGYEVVTMKSAEDALGDEDNLGVDVAIVDLRLPGMGGWELVDVLHARRPGLPVIVTSVLDPDDYPPVEAWLPKPFTGDAVRDAVARALEGRS